MAGADSPRPPRLRLYVLRRGVRLASHPSAVRFRYARSYALGGNRSNAPTPAQRILAGAGGGASTRRHPPQQFSQADYLEAHGQHVGSGERRERLAQLAAAGYQYAFRGRRA